MHLSDVVGAVAEALLDLLTVAAVGAGADNETERRVTCGLVVAGTDLSYTVEAVDDAEDLLEKTYAGGPADRAADGPSSVLLLQTVAHGVVARAARSLTATKVAVADLASADGTARVSDLTVVRDDTCCVTDLEVVTDDVFGVADLVVVGDVLAVAVADLAVVTDGAVSDLAVADGAACCSVAAAVTDPEAVADGIVSDLVVVSDGGSVAAVADPEAVTDGGGVSDLVVVRD